MICLAICRILSGGDGRPCSGLGSGLWLLLSGSGRPGSDSNGLLDNVAHPSANQILGEFQRPQIGDWLPMFSTVNEMTAFKVAAVNPPESLLWARPIAPGPGS